MPKLKVFNCQHPERSKQDIENLRKLMPQIIINEGAYGGDLDIANQNESIKPEDGLWDIFVKRIELFPLATIAIIAIVIPQSLNTLLQT